MTQESHIPPPPAASTTKAGLSKNSEMEEEILSSVKVFYPQLKPALKRLWQGHKEWRQTLPKQDAPTGENDAGTPYDIVNVEQLQRWADIESEQFLEALYALCEQRDLGLVVSEGIKDLVAEWDNLIAEQDTLQTNLTQEQQCVASLNTSFSALNTKYQLCKEWQQTERKNSHLFTTSIQSASRGFHSQKLSDPPLLNDGSEPTWEDWIGKICTKLVVNQDHYPGENDKMGYVLSQLSGKAAQHTESCSPYGSSVTNPYKSAEEILKDLKDIYEDSDKFRNYCWAYIDLIQGTKRFSDFFIEFHRLSTFLEYGESQCMDDIWDKITECLQAALSSQMVQPVFFVSHEGLPYTPEQWTMCSQRHWRRKRKPQLPLLRKKPLRKSHLKPLLLLQYPV